MNAEVPWEDEEAAFALAICNAIAAVRRAGVPDELIAEWIEEHNDGFYITMVATKMEEDDS